MSRFRIAVWLGVVAVACSVNGAEPYRNASYSSMQLASMHGGRGCGCDSHFGCDGRVMYREPMRCNGMCGGTCGSCCYRLCCPIIPAIVNKIDCMLQWAFCDPCNTPCMRSTCFRRPICCGHAWNGYGRCGCGPRGGYGCGMEPGYGPGDNWSPVTPADPFRDDELKTPPPTPAAERNAKTSSTIYARPQMSVYRSKLESKMAAEIESQPEIEPVTTIDPIHDTDDELAVEDSESSMVRHASAVDKVEVERKPSKNKKSPKKVTMKLSPTESRSSSYPRNPLRDEE